MPAVTLREKWLCILLLIGLARTSGDASTLSICNPNNRCFVVDTTVIGGRRLEDYRVTDPASPLVNVGARRAVLQANPSLSTQYCSINPYVGSLPSLPSIRAGRSTVRLYSYLSVIASGRQFVSQNADIDFEDLSTSDGYAIPRFGII